MILDFGGGYVLRHATAEDHAALAMICLKTGDAGQDASGREDDPGLMGQIYAVPYQVLEPDFAHVIDGPAGACGYLLGAPDTAGFNARLASRWYPALRARVVDPGPDASRWRGSDWARHAIHHGDLSVPEALRSYPSHGHIDLLPDARGKGVGARCMALLQARLIAAGSTGMFLDVNPRNLSAQSFYATLGFQPLHGAGLPERSTFMAKRF